MPLGLTAAAAATTTTNAAIQKKRVKRVLYSKESDMATLIFSNEEIPWN